MLLVKTERAGRHRQALPLSARPSAGTGRSGSRWLLSRAQLALIVSVFVVLVPGGESEAGCASTPRAHRRSPSYS